ncbi:hypothetical protein BH09ACT11_BH09ACT11_21390 [soil metagenome]
MIWLGLALIGLGVADLGHSIRAVRWWPESFAAASVLGMGLLCGVDGVGVLGLVAIAAAVFGWGPVVRIGFGRDVAWLPLCYGGVFASAAAVIGGLSDPGDGGLFGDYLGTVQSALLGRTDPEWAVLVVGILLAQLSTGNVIVRLVLSATHTIDPRVHRDPSQTLKGGRLLGPMERLAIVGLGLAGQLTAASIVIAAKGLLRFPELQSHRDDSRRDGYRGASIDDVTEYFLVGSFLSWGFALISMAVLAIAGT